MQRFYIRKHFLRRFAKWAIAKMFGKVCVCAFHYETYCPTHDGDYAVWKWGLYMEDWDE